MRLKLTFGGISNQFFGCPVDMFRIVWENGWQN